MIEIDVCSDDSVAAAFEKVRSEAGEVDVLVNNAGIAGAGPLEETPFDEHRQMFETNYFGSVRCIHAVLPSMRERRTGCIVNITSMAGLAASPNQIAYSATKWALESLGEALAHEIHRSGVRVVNVEPGVTMTHVFENSKEQRRFDPSSPCAPLMRLSARVFRAGLAERVPAEAVASIVSQAIASEDDQLRWPVGHDAECWLAVRQRIDSDAWVRLGAEMNEQKYAEGVEELFGLALPPLK